MKSPLLSRLAPWGLALAVAVLLADRWIVSPPPLAARGEVALFEPAGRPGRFFHRQLPAAGAEVRQVEAWLSDARGPWREGTAAPVPADVQVVADTYAVTLAGRELTLTYLTPGGDRASTRTIARTLEPAEMARWQFLLRTIRRHYPGAIQGTGDGAAGEFAQQPTAAADFPPGP